jgi:hypothetical protein
MIHLNEKNLNFFKNKEQGAKNKEQRNALKSADIRIKEQNK